MPSPKVRVHRKKETPPVRTCKYCGFTFPTEGKRITRKYCDNSCRDRYNNNSDIKKQAAIRWRQAHPGYWKERSLSLLAINPNYYVEACRKYRLKKKLSKLKHVYGTNKEHKGRVWGKRVVV